MVMDVARTSMIHAAAPHFLWPFAVQYAAHQINLQPRVFLPETTPTLRWTGKVGDASAFRVLGYRDFVGDTTADKLSSRAVPCVFLGFPPDAPRWQFYHPTSRRILSSQDVTFDESYAAHQINLQPRVFLPETTPTLRWTGKVGDASAFRVLGYRDFVGDTTADKLSSRAVPCVFLGFPPDAPRWQFYHPTSRRILSSQDVTFDESVSYYRLLTYRTASPPPPPPLFLAPGTPLVDPFPPQGPAPSGVSQVDPAEPVERLREWYSRRCRGAAGAGAARGAGGATGATGGAGAAGGGAGAGAAGGVAGAGAAGGAAGAVGAGGAPGATGGAGAAGGGAGAGATGGAAGAGAAGGAAGAVGAGVATGATGGAGAAGGGAGARAAGGAAGAGAGAAGSAAGTGDPGA
ncbi:unnamed protein product, partial [Closterium sp. NIES-53]